MSIRTDLEWNGDAVLAEVEKAAETALNGAAEEIRTSVVRTMPGEGARVVTGTGGSTGIRGKYVASNPGAAPGVRSGQLRNSINNEKAGRLKREVGTNVRYAPFLEFGTSKMAARPFMGLGFSRGKDKAVKRFQSIMRKALRG